MIHGFILNLLIRKTHQLMRHHILVLVLVLA